MIMEKGVAMSDITESDKHPRVVRAREFVRLIGRKQGDEALSLLAPNVTYLVPGHTPVSGLFTGPEAVAAHVSDVLALTEGSLEDVKWEDWMVGEHYVGLLVRVRVHFTGHVYDGRHLYLIRFDNQDRIDEVVVFFEDAEAMARAFR
jgi:ketosteroid isomerase-like protein